MAAFAMDIEQQLQIFSKNDEERTDFVRVCFAEDLTNLPGPLTLLLGARGAGDEAK